MAAALYPYLCLGLLAITIESLMLGM